MQMRAVRLRALRGGQVLRVGLLDALIWTWFRQVNYATPLMHSVEGIQAGPHLFPLGLLVAIAVVVSGRDRLPRSIEVAAIGAAVLATGAMAWAGDAGLAAPLGWVVCGALTCACVLCQVVRWERLALCDDLAALLASLAVSLLAAYGCSLFLMLVPRTVYNLAVMLAPLSLLVNGTGASWQTAARPSPSWRALATPPCILCCCLGLAGGFIVATGGSTLALVPAELLIQPSPLYFLMLLLYLALGVVACEGRPLLRAAWFAVLSLVWTLGSLLGLPWAGVLSAGWAVALSTLICLVLLACCLIGWGLEVGERPGAPTMDRVLGALTVEGRLTPREAEVAALLIEGRSLPVIQEKLSISEGTARTHAKHVYEKCAVRTKQELIDRYWAYVRQEG